MPPKCLASLDSGGGDGVRLADGLPDRALGKGLPGRALDDELAGCARRRCLFLCTLGSFLSCAIALNRVAA